MIVIMCLQNWGRSNLSRAASTGVVDGPTTRLEPTARSRSMVSRFYFPFFRCCSDYDMHTASMLVQLAWLTRLVEVSSKSGALL